MMNTNKDLLNKGIKYITISLPCLFIGPAVIHFAFINKLQTLYYLILAIGIGVCITAMALLFIGLKTIMKSLFNK
jgi:hypothetical protein